MLVAFESGVVRSEAEYFDLTEGELLYRLRAARRRRAREEVLVIKGAWHAAAWASFTRQMPPWSQVEAELLGEGPQEMSVEQLANMARFLHKAFGGDLVLNPDHRPPAPAGAEEAPRG